jgi:two-component system, chemotaxis family, sensor kinase CheA
MGLGKQCLKKKFIRASVLARRGRCTRPGTATQRSYAAMTIQDDETLRMYLEESKEHLADIEKDFLAIEENGADLDEELVNKVYRAVHSIKGGAGFMGLTPIKNLTHEMENILGKIRSRDLIPTTDIINVLLKASDTLKLLMKDIFNINNDAVENHILALKRVLSDAASSVSTEQAGVTKKKSSKSKKSAGSSLATEDPFSEPAMLSLAFPDGDAAVAVDRRKLSQIFENGKFIYLVELHIENQVHAKGKTCRGVLEEMEQTGVLISANFELHISSELASDWVPDTTVMMLLFATILKPEDINILFEVQQRHILELRSDLNLYKLDGEPMGGNHQELSVSEEPKAGQPSLDEMEVPESAWDETNEPEDLIPQSSIFSFSDETDKKNSKMEHDTSLRVHVSLLDQLMTLAGELVLSRNQLLQSIMSNDKRGSETAGQRIDLITSELQEAIMLTRMQSIGNVFNRFPRVVRDLARALGKKVELSLEGKDVELDKTIIEAIGDPLTHLVRNAVDHGIEQPQERKKAGKGQAGRICLKAYHEAGQVNIEISDDGKGMDGSKIASKAIEKGLISEEQSKLMSAREKTNLIFLPGFSTADNITEVSGRGVGMDVVRTNLDQLGGIIDIESEPGKGTTIRIKLPLTLAIIPCQMVMTGGERYAIPQVNLEELLRIPANQIRHRIEQVGNANVVRLRGNLLPLIRLAEIIGIETQYIDPYEGESRPDRRKAIADRRSGKYPMISREQMNEAGLDESQDKDPATFTPRTGDRRYHAAGALNIVVVSTGAMKYGLVVEQLHDSEEIVVKPLGRDLKKCKGYAGATIMGDGRVALILDVANLAKMAGLTTVEGTARAAEVAESEQEAIRAGRDKQSLLIFRSAEKEQFAAPLSLVERIEKIKRSDIEHVGGKRVIKYRGGSLPLFSIDEVATVGSMADQENLLVIVFMVAGKEIGLLGIGPIDALEANLNIDGITLRQTGIMGSAIINERTTLLIDIFEIVRTLNPQWFIADEEKKKKNGKAATILFAEDSRFFRSQVKGSMEKEGFMVLEAEDGVSAWDLLLQNGDEISIVVTDIEMPNMDGFALTQKIKQHPNYSHLPVIALTTLAGEEDITRGKEVGIDDYQIKLDSERLIRSIHNFLQAA